jgi:hypothetical protein
MLKKGAISSLLDPDADPNSTSFCVPGSESREPNQMQIYVDSATKHPSKAIDARAQIL